MNHVCSGGTSQQTAPGVTPQQEEASREELILVGFGRKTRGDGLARGEVRFFYAGKVTDLQHGQSDDRCHVMSSKPPVCL